MDAGLRTRAVGALLFNALVWGLSWWPFRELADAGLHTLWATAGVYAVACVVVLARSPCAWSGVLRTPSVWSLAAAAGTTNVCFNWAVAIGEVVRVLLLFYLMPVWAVLLARWLTGERLRATTMVRVVLALAGAAVVLVPADWPVASAAGAAATPVAISLSDALALAGGFFFALTNVLLRREGGQPPDVRALSMFAGGLVIPAMAGAVLAGQGVVPWLPAPSAGWVAGLAVLALAFLASNLALQFGAALLPTRVTAVVMLSEIVFAAGSAALVAGEAPGARTLAGGALILGAALLASLEDASED